MRVVRYVRFKGCEVGKLKGWGCEVILLVGVFDCRCIGLGL